MNDKSGIFKEYDNNFKLSETHIRKLHSILHSYAEQLDYQTYISIYVARENDSYIETSDLEKILAEENISGKLITTLSFELNSMESGIDKKEATKCMLVFTKDRETKIRFIASNENRDWCFLLLDEIDSQIQRILMKKPVKQRLLRIANLLTALTFLATPIAVTAFSNPFAAPSGTLASMLEKTTDEKLNYLVERSFNSASSLSPTLFWFFLAILVSMVLFITILEFKPLEKLSNLGRTSVFYWGDIMDVYDQQMAKLSKIKWGVIIAFLVSLAATFVGAIFV